MSAATELETSLLKREFGIRPREGDSCFHHALRAALRIYGHQVITFGNLDAPFPRIIQVGNGDDAHAYLVYDGKVYSRGITDLKGEYPELSLEQMGVQLHEDRTLEILSWAMDSFLGKGDKLGFGRLAGSLLPHGETHTRSIATLLGLAATKVAGLSDAEVFVEE